jgi:hypothetical protein
MALSSHHQQADQRIFTNTSKSRPPDNNIENENTQPKPPTIWIHLPFIGKRGNFPYTLVHKQNIPIIDSPSQIYHDL